MKPKSIQFAAAICFTASLSLTAQIKTSTFTKKPGNLSSQSSQGSNAKTAITISSASGDSNEYLGSATNIPISAAPGLSHFRLWYNKGDHKVRTIGVLHDNGGMMAKYSDQNGDDPFRVEAAWINIPGATGGTITAAGSGTFNIQLPPKPANTTLVISGFAFERQAGTDNNIRAISIKMDQEKSVAQVSFLDDQGADLRTIVEPTLTSGVLGLVPFGITGDSRASAEQLIKSIVNNKARAYAATIQYAFIPNSRIANSGAVSGTTRQKSGMQGQIPVGTDPIVYRGFVLRFNNSDHHLLGMGLHLGGLHLFPGQRGSATDPITYQDNNTDDNVQWCVDYSQIK